MIIETRLTEKDFINVNFVLLYQKFYIKFFIGIMILMLIINLILPFTSPNRHFVQIIYPLAPLSVIPLLTFWSAKRNFKSNNRIKETIEYKFDKDVLVIKGESFNSQLTWDKIYKVTKTKNWLLIWQNNQVANVIPGRDLWESHLADLKDILLFHKVKNNL